MKEKKQKKPDKILFSIGAKLITIISIIVILSLGSITIFVSWLANTDLRISAEDHNFETNRRSAIEAETLLVNMRSNSRTFIQTTTVLGSSSAVRESADFFFAENPQIAAVYYITPGEQEQVFTNSRFFAAREIDDRLAAWYFEEQKDALERASRGETVLNNAAPHFSRSVLALFFPWQFGGTGAVLFSSENINSNFGFGVNQSYMINNSGDVLCHSDFTLVKEDVNIADMDFVNFIFYSPESSKQLLIETDFGVMRTFSRPVEKNFLSAVQSLFDTKKEEDDGKIRQYVAFTKLNTAGAVVITSIEYDKIFEGIAATTRRNIFLTIAVLSISIIFIWFFSKTISVPLKSLAAAAKQIESGNFKMDLHSKNRDEIGVLTTGFQKMCSALNVFGRFTNREIAVKAMRGEIKPGGFPKHGTIFFSDIREFTAKSEQFTQSFGDEASNKIVQWLNSYFTQMINCIEKTNGVVDKFIGDAVMAHWGTAYSEGSPEKDAFNCVKASLLMREALVLMNKNRVADDLSDPSIRIGCGINSGVVTAGQIGSDMRMEYTVIGDPVNLASRIESLTKPLGVDILISEDTWNLVGEDFVTEEMPPVTVKGKEKPVRIFAVINFTGESKGPQSLSDVRSLLGIEKPNLKKIDTNADEKKYKIGKGKTKA